MRSLADETLLSWPRASSVRFRRVPYDANALCARFGNPCFALAAEHLAHVGSRAIAGKALEFFGHRIEPYHGVGAPVGEPDFVVGIDPHGIGAWPLTG